MPLTQRLPFRAIRRIRQPDVEPVSLAEVKDALGIAPEVADDDAYLTGLIAAARIQAEEMINGTLTLTRWQAVAVRLGSCGCSCVEMPYPPFFVDDTHPVEVTYTTADGVSRVVDQSEIRVNVIELPGRLQVRTPVYSGCCDSSAVVRWWAGVEKATDVPSPARTAIMRMVAGLYASRGDDPAAFIRDDPATKGLLASIAWCGGC